MDRINPNASRADTLATGTAALLLVAALAFGGGSRGVGDLVVQLCAAPVLALALLRWRHGLATRLQRVFLYWALAAVGVVALQLLPLPASWFARLPQRAAVLADLRQVRLDPTWLPMSLDRYGTVRALLSLLTFLAMWMLVSTLHYSSRLRLLKLAIAATVPLALLGFAQASAGLHSPLRFYEFHNVFGATGTFANRNHFASLLAMLLPLAIVLGRQAQQARLPGVMLGWYASTVVLLLAAMLTFSRAGVVLASMAGGAGLLLALAIGRSGAHSASRWRHGPLLVLVVVAVLATGNYAWSGIAARFDREQVLADLRWQYVTNGWEAARAYFPFGSGLGSFRAAYAPFEPVTEMVRVYALHAHNELVEVAVEAGWPGLLLVAGFVAWLVAVIVKSLGGASGRHATMAACAVAALVPLLHSLGDYPLRTLAVAVLLALLAAHLAAPGGQRDHMDHLKP